MQEGRSSESVSMRRLVGGRGGHSGLRAATEEIKETKILKRNASGKAALRGPEAGLLKKADGRYQQFGLLLNKFGGGGELGRRRRRSSRKNGLHLEGTWGWGAAGEGRNLTIFWKNVAIGYGKGVTNCTTSASRVKEQGKKRGSKSPGKVTQRRPGEGDIRLCEKA